MCEWCDPPHSRRAQTPTVIWCFNLQWVRPYAETIYQPSLLDPAHWSFLPQYWLHRTTLSCFLLLPSVKSIWGGFFICLLCRFSSYPGLSDCLRLYFLPAFHHLSLISWLNKPPVSCLLISSLLFFPLVYFLFSHPVWLPPYRLFHSISPLKPMLGDFLCNYGVNIVDAHSVQLLSLPRLDLSTVTQRSIRQQMNVAAGCC